MAGVLALVADLMDRSRLTAALGGDVSAVATAAQLSDRLAGGAAPDVVVVDLSRPGALDAVAGIRSRSDVRIVAFGAHVERHLLAGAEAAGCDVVLPRSRFFADVAVAVGRPAHREVDGPEG